jgi:gas vesicle protein
MVKFLIGLLIGYVAGFFTAALLAANKREDEYEV